MLAGMRLVLYFLTPCLAAALAALPPASAQEGPKADAPAAGSPAGRGGEKDLSTLFEALKAAPSAEAAKPVEEAILRQWLRSGSDTADLLMVWAVEAMAEKNTDLALRYLDTVVLLRPDYAEGWNKRATIHFQKRDYARSLSDIQRVLALEPRHYGALSGLGMILQDIGDEKRALEAFRKALAARDFATICDVLYTTDAREAAGGDDCQSVLAQETAKLRDPRVEIVGLTVRGDSAVVRLTRRNAKVRPFY